MKKTELYSQLRKYKKEFQEMIDAGEIPDGDVVPLEDGFLGINKICPRCHLTNPVVVLEQDYDNFRYGNYSSPQTLFHYLSPTEREIIMTGICKDCWEKLTSGESDEEDNLSDYEENGFGNMEDLEDIPF